MRKYKILQTVEYNDKTGIIVGYSSNDGYNVLFDYNPFKPTSGNIINIKNDKLSNITNSKNLDYKKDIVIIPSGEIVRISEKYQKNLIDRKILRWDKFNNCYTLPESLTSSLLKHYT